LGRKKEPAAQQKRTANKKLRKMRRKFMQGKGKDMEKLAKPEVSQRG